MNIRPTRTHKGGTTASYDAGWLKQDAAREGQRILDAFYRDRADEIAQIGTMFHACGTPKTPLRATCYNDFYKWSMLPVIRKCEEMFHPAPTHIWQDHGHSVDLLSNPRPSVKVTFSVDLRDPNMRRELRAAHEADNTASDATKLHTKVWHALRGLEQRPFDRSVFDSVLAEYPNLLSESDIFAVCGSCAKPRTLLPAGNVRPYGERPPFDSRTPARDPKLREYVEPPPVPPPYVAQPGDDEVVVYFYYDEQLTYQPDEPTKGMHVIEATGPWHLVTWLETTMMQCVYETKLRHDLFAKCHSEGDKPRVYNEWLRSALLRCAKSIAYTKRASANSVRLHGKAINPALFAGRRTGGLHFSLLQHLLFADNFTQVRHGGGVIHGSRCAADQLACLGTSSCEAFHILTNQLRLPCHSPIGTHAHELQMVNSVLFGFLDWSGKPYSQVVSHYLFYVLTSPKLGGAMPILPDTLGTHTFLAVANAARLPNGEPFLSVITSARQDSGNLDDFKTMLRQFDLEHLKIMASEIDTTETLDEAIQHGYDTFGAGGFFGDSVKVWDESQKPSSMAVKVVRVEMSGFFDQLVEEYSEKNKSPIVDLTRYGNGFCEMVGYPIKTGDVERGDSGGGKFSIYKPLYYKEPHRVESIGAKVANLRYSKGILDGTITKPILDHTIRYYDEVYRWERSTEYELIYLSSFGMGNRYAGQFVDYPPSGSNLPYAETRFD